MMVAGARLGDNHLCAALGASDTFCLPMISILFAPLYEDFPT